MTSWLCPFKEYLPAVSDVEVAAGVSYSYNGVVGASINSFVENTCKRRFLAVQSIKITLQRSNVNM